MKFLIFLLLLLLWNSAERMFAYAEYLYRTEYINVPVDHFTFENNRTFPLRYLINDTFWRPKDGPIFFYPGNEGDIRSFSQNSEFIWEIAQQFHGLVVFAEHRYYGVSLPFGNKSLSNPKYFGYLTSSQTLADFVDVVYHLRSDGTSKKPRSKNTDDYSNPVIAIGGSYGGMLAAWMRMKYPAVIEGSLASSAPIWYFSGLVKCDSFNVGVTNAFNHSSPQCVRNIRKSWDVLKRVAKTKSGRKWIYKNWKLCHPLRNKNDIIVLSYWLQNGYSAAAMVNYPYPTSFLNPVPANPVSEMCKALNKSSYTNKNLLRAVFKAVSVYFNNTGKAKCSDWRGSAFGDVELEGWTIQWCTEMVMPNCATGKTDMFFPMEWNFNEVSQFCYQTYGVYPQERLVEKIYGGKSIEAASNIIFSNGELDPWASGGVMKSISKTLIAVVLAESAHHLDLRASHPKDPKSVVNARKMYAKMFQKWIRNFHERHNHRSADESTL